MVTIRDVADSARVSPAAVSQLLNGRGSLRPETRQRIQSAISRLGYRRRPAGRPTRERSCHLAMVLGRFFDVEPVRSGAVGSPLHRYRIQHLYDAVSQRGDQLSVLPGAGGIKTNWLLQQAVTAGQINGVILASPTTWTDYAQWLDERRIPLVVLERTPASSEFSSVCVDNRQGGAQAATHLLDGGRARPAFVGLTEPLSWAEQREQGYRAALAQAGVELAGAWPIDPQSSQEALAPVCRQMLEREIDSVFAVSDGIAVKLIDTFESLGARVPKDVAVVGFDDLGYRSRSGLRPSSVGYDHQAFAEATLRVMRQLTDSSPTSCLLMYIKTHVAAHDTSGAV